MRKKRKRIMPKLRLAGDPILTTVCTPLASDEDVSHIIQAMVHILLNSKTGVGLSANQAGYGKRVIVAKIDNFEYKAMINPVFAPFDGSSEIKEEGCLSYPGKFKEVERFVCIDVAFTDEKGVDQCETYNDFNARIIQHEIDHLNGQCIVGSN